MKLDAKFYGEIKKAKDGTVVPEDRYVVFLASDNAFADILPMYRERCIARRCDAEQIKALDEMMVRLLSWRLKNPEKCKSPDAAGDTFCSTE